jgi:putative SOS response-associated peptidase YedK
VERRASQELLIIRRNHQTGEVSLDPLRWGLIPYWCSDPKGGRKPINAKCESVRDLPTFREAYAKRRCIVPVDGFFEWKAIKGQKAKQPYAVAMKDGAPFGLAGIWENWKEPASGEWIRTFAIITTDANELVAEIHDRMPVILSRYDYARWLGEEPDPVFTAGERTRSRNRATAAASGSILRRPYRTFDYAIRLHGKEVREALVCRFVRLV